MSNVSIGSAFTLESTYVLYFGGGFRPLPIVPLKRPLLVLASLSGSALCCEDTLFCLLCNPSAPVTAVPMELRCRGMSELDVCRVLQISAMQPLSE